jgi:site-specific recombinase XerD
MKMDVFAFDIRYIQQFLGHGDLNTTKVYLRLVAGHLKDD